MTRQQAALHIAIQRADHRRRHHAFWRAADAVEHVDFAVRHTGKDRGRHVAVRERKHAYAKLLQLRDDRVVARFRQNRNRQLRQRLAQRRRDITQIGLQRQVEIDMTPRRRADNQLFHIHIRRVQKTAFVADRQHR